MVNDSGQRPHEPHLCLVCSQCTAKLDLHICGHCGHIRVDGAQNDRFALVEMYKALGIFLASGPKENIGDFLAATQTIIDQTKQTTNA